MLMNLKRRAAAIWSNPSGKSATAMLFAATSIGQTVQFLGVLVITRLYSPSEFGTFAAFLAINNWLLPLCCLRYEWAIPIAEDEKKALDLRSLSLVLAVVNSTILVVVVYFLSGAFFSESFKENSWILCFALIFMGVHNSNQLWFVRHSAFAVLVRLRLVSLTAPVICQITFGVLFGGVESLVLGYIVGFGLSAACGIAYSRDHLRLVIANMRLGALVAAAKANKNFALFTCPAAMISGATRQMPLIVLPGIFGTMMAGIYALAQRVVLQPAYLINYSVRTVFWAHAGKTFREQPDGLRGRFFKTSIGLSVLLIPAMLFVPFGPPIFAFCFGEEWREAGLYAGILIIPAVTYIIATSTNCLNIVGYNKLQILIDGSQFGLTAALLALAWWLSFSPVTAVYCIAGSAMLAHVVLWTVNSVILTRGFGRGSVSSPSEQGQLSQEA